MSTYTDLHIRRRENLTILRKPGAPEDGITPQRVIFANPENIYEGTFKGKIEAVGVSFTSVDLTDVTINGGKIKDATIYSDGREMSIADLTSNVSEISGKLDDALENITSAQISCGDLDKRINDLISGESGVQKISATVVNIVSAAIDNSLSSLSSELCGTVDYRLDSLESRLSNQMSGVSSLLSNALTSETSSRIDCVKAISVQLDSISARLSNDENAFKTFVDVDFAQHVQDFDDHVQENKETFDLLSNCLLSSLEHDRHYTIVDDFKEIPYHVKDFAVNVIEAGASDVEIKYSGTVIGYGTYIEGVDGSTKLRVSISTDDKIPALINAIPGTYNADLKEGSANRQAVGGAYFYYITWLSTETDNTIKLEKIDQQYYDLVETSYNTTVGKIKNALVDSEGKFISGTVMFQQTGTEFDAFYNALSNGLVFNNAELSSTLSNGCQVKLNNDYKTFSLGRDIKTQEIREIVDSTDDHTVFGRIVVTDVSASEESIIKIPVTGIDLTKYGIIKHNRAVELTEENSFYGNIANDLVVSCDIDSGNIFSVVQTKEKFAYPYYKPTSVGPHELTDAIGYVVPGQVNTPINGGVFDKLSVQTETIDWSAEEIVLKTHECLSTSYNTYTCQEGTIGDQTTGWMSIIVVKDVDTTWTVNIDGYDGVRGVEIKAAYKVDTSLYAVVPEEGTYTLIARSIPTNVLEGEEKTFPEASYTAVSNGPKPVAGETDIDLKLSPAEDASLQIQVPAKDSKYFDTSREFIVAAKIASASQKVQVKLVDNGSKVEYQINGGKNEIWIPANRWSTIRVVEVDQNKFLVEDLDNVYLRDEIAKINSSITAEIEQRIVDDNFLSGKIDSNKAEIDSLWKNIRGGLNYIDNLSVAAAGYDTVKHAFAHNKSDGVTVPDLLREGFFWTIKTIDKNAHYFIEGLEVEQGDWFIVKNNTPLSDVTSADIAVFDAQDFDNFKLSGDNNAVGDNAFIGNNTFTGSTTFNSGAVKFEDDVDFVGNEKNVVVEGNIAISGVTSVKDLIVSSDAIVERNNLVSGDAEVAGSTKLMGNLDIVGNTTASSISVDALSAVKFESISSEINCLSAKDAILVDASVENATVQSLSAAALSIELSNLKYGDGLSTMEELTSDLQEQLTSAQLSIDGISSYIASEISNHMRYFGTFANGYSTDTIPLTSFLWENIKDEEFEFRAGYQYRISSDVSGTPGSTTIDDGYHKTVLFGNDYIVFNKQVVLSNATWADIDIIRDAQVEGKELERRVAQISGIISGLSGELSTISSDILLSSEGLSSMLSGLSGEVSSVSSYLVSAINLSASKPLTDLSGEVSAISSILTNDISYLSSELSDYHNTLSGIDRESDTENDIKSDNLILTDVNLYGGTDHSHRQYYMTFISGTVVLKPIAK